MNKTQFKLFIDEMPKPNKYIVVTNNIDSLDAHGEMSHVWMTSNVFKGDKSYEGVVAYSGDRKIISLSHWKYA